MGVEVFLRSRSRKIMLARVGVEQKTKNVVRVEVELKKYLRVRVIAILLRLANPGLY